MRSDDSTIGGVRHDGFLVRFVGTFPHVSSVSNNSKHMSVALAQR